MRLILAFVMTLTCTTLGAQTAVPWSGLANDELRWDLNLALSKGYTLSITLAPGPAVKGEVWIEDEKVEKFSAAASTADRVVELPPLFLMAGPMVLQLKAKSSQLSVRKVTLRESFRIHSDPLRSAPMDPLATPEAQKLLAYLVSESGHHILSGQQDLTWNDRIDMIARVKALTGKEPALEGFDFLNYLPTTGTSGHQQTQEALEWSNRGGLVAFSWHWRVGTAREFYSKQTDFRIPDEDNTTAWASLDHDLDIIAAELRVLQSAHVPVLWRPLHEASGGWFWWGASGPAAYKRLWHHVYNRLVNQHGLHNLLWVWNGQSEAWYPGDETVDIIGWDIYGNDREYFAYPDTWRLAQSIPTGQAKLVTLSENGPIPDPELLVAQKVPWSWFMTWNDGDQGNPVDDFFSGTKYMDDAFKNRVYSSPYVITLDRLPRLR